MALRQVFVVPSGSGEARQLLAQVLAALDCVEVTRDIKSAEAVLVLMGGALPPEAELRVTLAPAADGAFDLIGVHAPDGDGTIPDVMEDWATSGFRPLDAEALRAALCAEQEGWFDAAGDERPEPPTARECRKRNC